jgi:hypothetical protein
MGTCLSQTSHGHALYELRVRCTSHARWSPPPLLYPAQGSIHVTFTLLPTNFGAQNSCQHFLISCNVPHTALPCAERAPSLVHMPCAGAPTPARAPGARVRTKTLLLTTCEIGVDYVIVRVPVDLPRPCPARALLPSLPPLLYIIGTPCRF